MGIGITIVASLVASLTHPPSIHAGRAQDVLSKEALEKIVVNNAAAIGDLHVSFTHNATKWPAEEDVYIKNAASLWWSNASIRVEETYSLDPKLDDTTYKGTRVQTPLKILVLKDGQEKARQGNIGSPTPEKRLTQGLGFFDINLLNPPREPSNGSNDQSLRSVLASSFSTVRPALEEVNGRACHVVDVKSPGFEYANFSAWLDAERGCVPLKQEVCRRSVGGEKIVAIRFTTTEVHEAATGIWFVVQGTKENFPGSEQESKWIMSVNKVGEQWDLQINKGVPAGTFEPTIPPGYTVIDTDTGQTWQSK